MAKVVVKKTTIKKKGSTSQKKLTARSATINGNMDRLKANAVSVKQKR